MTDLSFSTRAFSVGRWGKGGGADTGLGDLFQIGGCSFHSLRKDFSASFFSHCECFLWYATSDGSRVTWAYDLLFEDVVQLHRLFQSSLMMVSFLILSHLVSILHRHLISCHDDFLSLNR